MAQPTFAGTILRRGASGPDVALVQQWLNEAADRYPALARVEVDGHYGPATAAAVRAYQRQVGLAPDGAVGILTWNSLADLYAAANGSSEIWPGIPLQQGDRGAAVRSAQIELRKLVPSLATDGDFGHATRNAVFAYQVVYGLAPDGVLGRGTWEKLYNR